MTGKSLVALVYCECFILASFLVKFYTRQVLEVANDYHSQVKEHEILESPEVFHIATVKSMGQ